MYFAFQEEIKKAINLESQQLLESFNLTSIQHMHENAIKLFRDVLNESNLQSIRDQHAQVLKQKLATQNALSAFFSNISNCDKDPDCSKYKVSQNMFNVCRYLSSMKQQEFGILYFWKRTSSLVQFKTKGGKIRQKIENKSQSI